MNTNLITYDMENFLKKYTRFMTKNIYININQYETFLNQYNYLYQELSKNAILFKENIKYKKIQNIKKNKHNLLKLHNQKYLKKAILKYQSFFDELNYSKILDTNKKAIILADEENLLVINNKNTKELVIAKIKYLINYCNLIEEKILILSNKKDNDLEKLLQETNLTKVTYNDIDYYNNSILNNKKIISTKEKYEILFNYLTINLFGDKEKFQELYKCFKNNLYLNKDYKDFDTFKDYHNYIYKKIYLTSNLSLNKFNEKEIEKRKNYLRTINNVIMNNKEEVDIANFLYLNSIDYKYQDKTFIIENNNKISYISFEKKENNNDNIYLEMKDLFGNNYVEKLIYELIKRRYPLELKSDKEIYNKLKDTTINNYFNEFINKYLIPLIDYYDQNKSFSNTKISQEQEKVLIDIYKFYKNHLEEKNILTQIDFKSLLEKQLNKYKYIIITGEIDINPKTKTLKIIDNYKEELLLKENIKLLYDYKKYLMENNSLPIKNTYKNIKELNDLTTNFLKELFQELETNKKITNKEIIIYQYEDDKRLLINKNISKLCLEIIKNTKNSLLAVDSKKQIDNIILKNYFTKYNENNLINNDKIIIPYEKITNIKTIHDNIILLFLIKDSYHENLLLENELEDIKLKIYTLLNKTRNKLIILCPKSKKEILRRNIKNLKFKD